ncbi:glycoside hydrolase family 25 protein [Pseudoalteromonas fenneropenaei]|uniref:Glycoside hydrolase family 25 protein n=1 Tax=Pseudoalteromonas fenneropenaei TaxID=1737459 RepID=A0ABV7CLF2_9GAMM
MPLPQTEQTVHGIDVSHYQGTPDWQQIASQPLHFVYLKATDGITYLDPQFKANLSQLKDTPLLYGAYHFFEPKDDPKQQAAHYLSYVQGQALPLVPVVDIEVTQGVAADEIQTKLQVWLDEVEQALGCRPMIYSNGPFWQRYLGTQFNHYPFWLADYAVQPTLPASRDNWQLWQYSEKGQITGISQLVDLNVFKGTPEALASLRCAITEKEQ